MRLHRLLLRLYPADVRGRDADAMLETIELRLRLADSRAERAAIALREAAGLISGALRARIDPRSTSRRIPAAGFSMIKGLFQDIRYALRVARRDPLPTAVIVLTLALGIGANVAIFSVVDAVLLRPLPYTAPDRLVRLTAGGGTTTKAIHDALRGQMRTLTDLSGFSYWGVTVGGENDPEVLGGVIVSTNYFELLGAPAAAIGRTFVSDDARPGNDDVAVISWGLFQRRFGGDPAIVGRRAPIDNDHHSSRIVIGVMPEHFKPVGDWQVWMPYLVDPTDAEDWGASWYLQMLGRMGPDVAAEEVTLELRSALGRLAEEGGYGLDDPDRVEEAVAVGLREYLVGPVRETLWILLAGVGLVLVIASFNVANLLFARSGVRRRELAVRSALGAPRGRLLRQLLTESVLLSGMGALIGLVAAELISSTIAVRLADTLPRAETIGISASVLAFAAGVTVSTGLLFGTAPSLLLMRGGPGEQLAGGRGSGNEGAARASRILVVVEVAIAVVVVVGAGLMLRTLDALWSAPTGFDPDGVGVARAIAPSARYPEAADQRRFWIEAMERVAAAPGIDSAAAIHLLPLRPGNWGFPFRYDGQVIEEGESLPVANFRVVTEGYFRTMGISLLQGRDFDSRDGVDAAETTIINRTMAEELWPGESPLGKRVYVFGDRESRVVGVVDDVRQFRLDREPEMEMYRSAAQWPLASMVVVTRSSDPAAASRSVETALHEVDPAVPVFGAATMREVMTESLAATRLAVGLLSAFAGLALVLGGIGVYGVMSYVVAQRTHEIGIRMALGAPGGRVRQSVVASALRPVVLGVLVGLVAGAAALRVMSSLLYGVEAVDPATYAAVAAAVLVTGALAGWVPARRASRVDPLDALRAE